MPRQTVSPTSSPLRRLAGVMTTVVLVGGVAACGSDDGSDSRTVTVYTGRHYGIEPVFDAFTAATGIEVRFAAGSDPELRERLSAEGENTPADLVIAADAANIELAATAGLLATVDSEKLTTAIPEQLRSANNEWFSLSRRLRVIMYSTERVTTPPSSYADLGAPQWSGRLCLRPSTHPYTQSLVASLILNRGANEARTIVDSWVKNEPLYINSDTDILKAIASGDCDVAIANTYYLARLLAEEPTTPVAISWPEQDGVGAHLNVSAAGVTRSAQHPTEALELLEWLATDGQKTFSEANFEYPADPNVAPADVLVGFGEFTADLDTVRQLGASNTAAVDLLSRAGYE